MTFHLLNLSQDHDCQLLAAGVSGQVRQVNKYHL